MSNDKFTREGCRVQFARIDNVAERWRDNYFDGTEWRTIVSGSSRDIYDKLIGLGPNATAAAIEEVIGNKSWTNVFCVNCLEYKPSAAVLGDSTFCPDCLRSALAILDRVGGAH